MMAPMISFSQIKNLGRSSQVNGNPRNDSKRKIPEPSIASTSSQTPLKPTDHTFDKPREAPKPNFDRSVSQTHYVDMLLGLDAVPRSHNLLAAFSTWILLAGFIVIPGTFTSIQHNKKIQQAASSNVVEHAVVNTVNHASLICIAGTCCAIGLSGAAWLWWRWRWNYVWLINKIFL